MYMFADMPADPSVLPVPIVREYPMLRMDTALLATFTLDVPNVRFIIYKFESSSEVDDNNGLLWNTIIVDREGRPIERALECRALAYTGFASDSSYRLLRDIGSARQDIQEELKFHPQSVSAWDLYFGLERLNKLGISIEMAQQIDSVMDGFAAAPTEASAPRIARWYTTLGRRDKLVKFEDAWLAAHPEGNYATYVRFSRARFIKSAPDMVNAMRNLVLSTARDTGWAATVVRDWLFTYFVQMSMGPQADSVLQAVTNAPTAYSDRVARAYLESGKGLARAHELIVAAIAQEEKSPTWATSPSVTMRERDRRQKMLAASFETTAGKLDESLGRPDSAAMHYSRALFASRVSDTAAIQGLLRTLKILPHIDQFAGMMPLFGAAAANDSTLWPHIDTIYKRLSRTQQTLHQIKAMAAQMKSGQRESEFCRRIVREVAPSFKARLLDGGYVSSDSLRGKVVVIDFWGTWCQPCRVTMPQFDNAFQQYKNNKDVVFLAIDTHELIANADTLDNVIRRFLDDREISPTRLTVPVALDSANEIATAFDIRFFPTFVIIDRSGVLRVKQYSVADENVASDVKFMVDMALRGACGIH